jgi:hypothetical protein
LVETFEPPTIATSGRFGFAWPGRRDLGEPRGPVRGRLGPMRRAEGVVHIDIGKRRDLARERLVIFLLALVGARVLEHHDLSGVYLKGLFRPVGNDWNVQTQKL